MGFEVEAERKARGLSVEEYKEVRDQMIGEIEQEKKPLSQRSSLCENSRPA